MFLLILFLLHWEKKKELFVCESEKNKKQKRQWERWLREESIRVKLKEQSQNNISNVLWYCVELTWFQNANSLSDRTGTKNRNGTPISIKYVPTTLSFWNHSGSWWAYQASGVGMHWLS